ncbi:MAG: hypothetical protein J6D00_08625 [Christensenellaceae bacterium]|nr:hypothetical protein [Christensenellaceae bacterium]
MKKRISLLLVIIMIFCLTGCKTTLESISKEWMGISKKVDYYTIVRASFYGKNGCPEGHENCCVIRIDHYKDSYITESGIVLDYSDPDEHINPCEVSDKLMTIGYINSYSYTVDEENRTVTFSKPFLGYKEWDY